MAPLPYNPQGADPMASMAQMMQMVIGLKQLQMQVGQQQLAREEFQTNRRLKAMETISSLPMQARPSALQALMPDMSTRDYNNFLNFSGAAPESLDTQKTSLAFEGAMNASPDFRGTLGAEAAAANATGQNRGGLAQSGFVNSLLNGGNTSSFDQTMLAQWSRGIGERLATGRTPEQAAVGNQYLTNPSLAANRAGVESGSILSAPEVANLDIAHGNLQLGYANNKMNWFQAQTQRVLGMGDLQAKMAEVRTRGGVTPAQQQESLTQADNIVNLLSTKPMNEQARAMNVALLNRHLQMLGIDPIQPGETMPARLSGLSALFSEAFGTSQNYNGQGTAAPMTGPAASVLSAPAGVSPLLQYLGANAVPGAR